jgi:aspartyl-tRNA(Asn)/glutamyl-tRNA(Gln) amidotransferase subunit B
VEWCILTGLALNCQIAPLSKFDRKSYFYPDLPKGYQISQYDMPLTICGSLKLKIYEEKTIRIRRVHLEEDTGKLIHTKEGTLVDFNRSGVPLVEIVTEPDFRSPQEAKLFVQKLQQIIRYLGVSDADMEKGSMRLEPNVSVIEIKNEKLKLKNYDKKINADELPKYKVEVKNINSFKFLEMAISYEIKRQIKILKEGGEVKQETRGWSEAKGVTLPRRGKEEAKDYRYFPEPDIPPMRLDKAIIRQLADQIPELPDAKLARFIKEYKLSEYDGNILTDSLFVANYFEEAVKGKTLEIKTIANWIINKRVDINKITPMQLTQVIAQKSQGVSISDEELGKVVKKVLTENQKAVNDYRAGRAQALMFLVGQVIKETRGQANPTTTKTLIENLVKSKE